MNRPATAIAPFLLALVYGCGGGSESASDADTVATAGALDTAAANAAVAPLPGSGNAAPLTAADIDRWQRGMQAELKAVLDAGARLKAARSSTDTLEAMFAAGEMATVEAGARAAGVSVDRYRFINSNLSAAVSNLTPLEQEMPMVKDMPASMVDELKRNRESALERMSTDVPPAVIESLRPRASDLRKQSLTLVGERLRASGAA